MEMTQVQTRELQNKYMGLTASQRKKTTATAKESLNLLMEVNVKMMGRKFLKYGLVESILMHMQNIPIPVYYAKKKRGK